MKRINVIGTSGSGKSHFSKRLAEKLNFQYIELDAMYWKSNWEEPEIDTFLSELEETLESQDWVLDGNHSRTNPIKWHRVDTIVWIDYSFSRTFRQILSRSIKRSLYRNEIWEGTGNRESFKRNFLSSKSVVLWMLRNYSKTKEKYGRLFKDERLKNIKFIHITSPKQAESFLRNIQCT